MEKRGEIGALAIAGIVIGIVLLISLLVFVFYKIGLTQINSNSLCSNEKYGVEEDGGFNDLSFDRWEKNLDENVI